MNSVVAAFPGRELHVILDNLNTHKKNQRWLKKHPTVHFHFTPTRSSWLNQIETWFSILQGQSLNGASFTAIEQLQGHIDAFIAAYNETAEPFAWTKKKGLPAAVQKSPYHSTLIPGTRFNWQDACREPRGGHEVAGIHHACRLCHGLADHGLPFVRCPRRSVRAPTAAVEARDSREKEGVPMTSLQRSRITRRCY